MSFKPYRKQTRCLVCECRSHSVICNKCWNESTTKEEKQELAKALKSCST